MSAVDHAPDPQPRGTHAPYPSMWVGPLGAVAGWALAGLAMAVWFWLKAPLIDNTRPDLPHHD